MLTYLKIHSHPNTDPHKCMLHTPSVNALVVGSWGANHQYFKKAKLQKAPSILRWVRSRVAITGRESFLVRLPRAKNTNV